jgi:prophage DNA circulation protein
MATWRDRIRGGASFRGVPFHVEVAELGGGRRTVRHEYPLRDVPYVEDLGRRARTFTVDAYVLGEDYLERRDALIAALETAGPGELVHPYYGTRRVAVGPFRVRESTADGGLARFSIDFEETAVSPPFPAAVPAGAVRVAAAADLADAAIGAGYLTSFRVAGVARSALTSLSGVLASAAAAMDEALAPFVRDTQQLAGMKRDLDALVLDADALVRQPVAVLGGLRDVIASLGTAPLTPSLGIRALLTAYGFAPSSSRPPSTTATRRQEQANWDALVRLFRTLAVVQAARLATAERFDSYDAAVAVRDAIGDRLDEQAELADDEGYAALLQLRADLVRAVPGEESDLPRLVRHTPAYTVPSLVLAHQLYGDVSLEADLVARNRVARPGFVPGGVELEVLARA